MKSSVLIRLVAASGLALSLASAPSFAHGNHKRVCKKDGKVIKVKGKTSEEKKAACEAKGGEWEEADE